MSWFNRKGKAREPEAPRPATSADRRWESALRRAAEHRREVAAATVEERKAEAEALEELARRNDVAVQEIYDVVALARCWMPGDRLVRGPAGVSVRRHAGGASLTLSARPTLFQRFREAIRVGLDAAQHPDRYL